MPSAVSENPYLSGNYAPVDDEVTAFDLPVVHGAVPAELDGRYLCNGPNPFAPDPATYHWFIGSGMVHGVKLGEGRAQWYRNRYVRAGGIVEAKGWPDPGGPAGQMPSSVNTNVIGIGGRTFACVEAGAFPVELTYDLDTVGRTDLGGLPGPFTAHPKVDPVTGELHAACYFWGFDAIQYIVVGPDAQVRHVADIPVPGKPMMHDLSITETRVVLYDMPCTFDLDAAMSGAGLPYRWNPDYGARIGVLPLGGTAADVRWYEVENCYVFHPVNAYDLPDGRLVIDVIRHPSMFATDLRGPNEGSPTLDRWTVDPTSGKVLEERLDDRGQELPRVDERLVGRRARYGYAIAFGSSPTGIAHGPLLRHDLVAGTVDVHDYGPGRTTREAVFVPRADDAAEDDGWVMSIVHDAATDSSQLVLLDGQDFTGEPACVIQLPQRVPYGFHGNWVPDPA